MEMRLSDLRGARIEDVGTVRADEDGDDMVWFYLSNGIVFGSDVRVLLVVSGGEWDDAWVDFTDHLEEDSPLDETDWHDRPGRFLLLADLPGMTIAGVWTTWDGAVYLALDSGIVLRVPLADLAADSDAEDIWTDFDALLYEAQAA